MQAPYSEKRHPPRSRRYANASTRCARGIRREPPHPQPIASPQNGIPRKQPKLLDQIRTAVRTRNYSIRTERTYVDWAHRYILFHGKQHPAKLGAADINRFLSSLTRVRKLQSERRNAAPAAAPAISATEQHAPIAPDSSVAQPTTHRQQESPFAILKRFGMAALWAIACIIGKRAS